MDPVKETAASNETVTISKSELSEIIAMNKKLMDSMQNPTAPLNKVKDVTTRTVTIMFVDEMPVIGYKNRGTADRPIYIYEKQDPNKPTEYLAFVDLIIKGKGKEADRIIPMNYVNFVQDADRKDCKVLKNTIGEWKITQGTTIGKRFVEGTYHMVEMETAVPVEIIGKTSIFTVELPDGSSTDVHERYVNISK